MFDVNKIEKIALGLLEQLKGEDLTFAEARLVVSQMGIKLNCEMDARKF